SSHRAEQADRHEVARAEERLAQARGAAELAARVLRAPGSLHTVAFEDDRRVEQHRGRREAVLECGRVQERLEARSRQAPSLRDAVVLVGEVVEATDER